MRYLVTYIFIVSCFVTKAQNNVWVFLKDKPNAEIMLSQPELYLSSRAIERRIKQGIKIDESDIPVYQQYIETIQEYNFKVKRTSKWLNAVVVPVNNSIEIELLRSLPFVKEVKKSVYYQLTDVTDLSLKTSALYFNYGNATAQINQVKGEFLHQSGYAGENIRIAVIDGGFTGVDKVSAFDSLWQNNRIIATYDFVGNDTDVFHFGSHGYRVLSVMAANVPNQIVGTAPRAEYILLQSENEATETKIEEYNWIAAAEFADSVGADVINSSLGYNTFDGGNGNYQYSDFDGRTTVISQGAIFAHRKGILVVSSMGNEGSTNWKKMLTPADTDSILSVGGVDYLGAHSSQSGHGPTYDGRLKPNTLARAESVTVLNSAGNPSTAGGTSFATPIISGLSACLWQAFPQRSNYEILWAIERSGSRYFNPDTLMGYGIPDFSKAFWLLKDFSVEEERSLIASMPYPVPFKNAIHLRVNDECINKVIEVKIFTLSGEEVYYSTLVSNEELFTISINKELPQGVYILHLSCENKVQSFKVFH